MFYLLFSIMFSLTLFVEFHHPIKGILYYSCLLIIFVKIISNIGEKILINKDLIKRSLLHFTLLSSLSTPYVLYATACGYQKMSRINPFYFKTGWYYKRLLMPALNYILQWDYLVFSLSLNFILIYLILFYFYKNNIELKWYEELSIFSSSFVITTFILPGLPDVLLHILLMITLIIKMPDKYKYYIYGLCLCTHEGSIFLILPFSYYYTKNIKPVLYLCLIYIIIYLLSKLTMPYSILHNNDVGGKSTLYWILTSKYWYILGWLAAYKLLWFFPKKNKLIIFGASIITLLGIDTSRFIQWGSYSILESLKENKPNKCLLIINLIIPSYFIVSHSTPMHSHYGLYYLLNKLIGLIEISASLAC